MSGKYCDFQLDIHGGGADLTFPHHENEVAQSEAATGKQFARYWAHNGFITVAKEDGDEVKMGKSKGNAFWLEDVFAQFPPAAVRLWILGTHYRMPLTYSGASLQTALGGLDRIYNCLEAFGRLGEDDSKGAELAAATQELDARFRAALNDDFNTPQGLAVVYDAVSVANTAIQEGAGPQALAPLRTTLHGHLNVLGLPLVRPQSSGAGIEPLLELLIDVRAAARQAKQYDLADTVRDRLAELGFELADRPDGTTWTSR